ncbi:MAG: transporter substrate-binding domain-containing protein [Pseudomonadota bacterium]
MRLLAVIAATIVIYSNTLSAMERELPAIQWSVEEQAFLQSNPTIVVGGEMDWPPMDYVEGGEYKGVAKDYLDELSQLTGLRFDVMTGYTWSRLFDMLSHQEIDMVPMMYWSEQRGRDFNLTNPYLTVRHYAFTRSGAKDIRSMEDLTDKVVAIPLGYASIDYMREHHPEVTILEVNTVIEAIDSVLTGRADVVIENTASVAYYTNKQSILGLVPAFPISFEMNNVQMAVRKDMPILRGILQKGLDQISVAKATEIMGRWTGGEVAAQTFLTEQVSLSAAEVQYAQNKATLTACVNTSLAPYENYKKGVHQGVTRDYLAIVSKTIAKPASYVAVDSWQSAVQHLNEGRCDLASLAPVHEATAPGLSVTDAYITEQVAIATGTNEAFYLSLSDLPDDRPIGVLSDYVDIAALRLKYPYLQFASEPSIHAGLEKVNSSEWFGFIAHTPLLRVAIQRNFESNLKISGNFEEDAAALGMAVTSKEPILANIVAKVLDNIPSSQRQNIYRKWVAVAIHRHADYTFLKRFAVLFTILLVFIGFAFWQQQKYRRQIERKNGQLEDINQLLEQQREAALHMAYHDPLTKLGNRGKLLNDLTQLIEESKCNKQLFAFMFIDLDRFKLVNDTLGHNAGDQLLQKVSERLLSELRDTDSLYRVGGDEFIVLMRDVSNENVPHAVAQRLIDSLGQPFSMSDRQASIGATIGISVCPDDSVDRDELIKFADNAMYEAKEGGRNSYCYYDTRHAQRLDGSAANSANESIESERDAS